LSASKVVNTGRSYRPDIDGIRAIAILSVVLYHAGVPRIPGGFTGVDIFFVISGYLIGGHIFSDLQTGTFSFLEFYRLRAKRILPAFYAVLAFTILAVLVLLSPFEAWEFAKSATAATLSISNLHFWRSSNYFRTQSELQPLLMTWSLGVEEQFYAIIPVLMVVLVRIRRRPLLPAIFTVCALSFFLAWRELGSHPAFVFYLLPARAWELGVGVALAVSEKSTMHTPVPRPLAQWVGLAGTALMLAPMALLNAGSPFPGAAALPSVLGTALIIATPGSWINRRLLCFSPLVFIGRISYSWYLWHWPILALLRIISGSSLPPAAIAFAIAASLGLAIASYFFIEQPFRKSTRAPAPLLLRYALTSFALLAACAAIWQTHGIPLRYPQLAQIESAKTSLTSNPCQIHDGDKPNLSQQCYPSSGDRPSVALWGDSHAAALAPGLRAVAITAGYGFDQLSKSGCRPVIDVAVSGRLTPHSTAECVRFNQQVLNRLETDRRVRIVIIADAWARLFSRQSSAEGSEAGSPDHQVTRNQDESQNVNIQFLENSIRSLQTKGKLVIVMEDVPTFDIDPLSNVRASQIPIRHTIANWLAVAIDRDVGFTSPRTFSSDVLATSILRGIVATLPGTTLVDLKREFCSEPHTCIYQKDGQLLYLDHQHLSPDGARYALRDFHLPLSTQ
jgi:peptidoglycan/LPS O-acetylase OafA/YrhL